MTSVRRALVFSFIEKFLSIFLALASNVVLARLLTPNEIGIYSVTIAVIGMAHVVRDFGVGNFLVQQKELTEAHIRTAFGLSLLIGATLFIVLYLSADAIARFYSEPQIAGLMKIVALNFLVLPFCTISLALLRRDLNFKKILHVSLAAACISTLTIIALAINGLGPASMAIGSVIGNLVTGLGSWLGRQHRQIHLPSLSEWRTVSKFGGQNLIANLATSISMDINDLATGKILGFSAVATLSRAQGLMYIFHRDIMAAVKNVAFPAFSRAHRATESVDEIHSKSVTSITAIAWPFYGFLALFPLEILRIMFGPQWDHARTLVPIFCLAGASAATASLAMNAMVAIGRNDLVTKTELVFQPARALIIVGVAIIFKTVEACAWAYTISFLIHPILSYFVKEKCLPTDFSKTFAGLRKSAALALISLTPAFLISLQASLSRTESLSVINVIAAAILVAIFWVIGLFLINHPISQEKIFNRLSKTNLLKRKG
jgi:lipopolysaccharide exporter